MVPKSSFHGAEAHDALNGQLYKWRKVKSLMFENNWEDVSGSQHVGHVNLFFEGTVEVNSERFNGRFNAVQVIS